VTTDEVYSLLQTQRARFPDDGAALDRVGVLLGLPPLGPSRLCAGGSPENGIPDSGAAAISELSCEARPLLPPSLSLPLRIQPAKACALGWSSELFSLTLLIGNVELRQSDGALVQRGEGPMMAICAEYDRPLTSIEPPSLAGYPLESARAEGVPVLRLPGGFLRSPLRLERTSPRARVPAMRQAALAGAERFLGELDDAWGRCIGSVLEVAWPIYKSERGGPPLDAVGGGPLPALDLR
jgi:hypothetical protein